MLFLFLYFEKFKVYIYMNFNRLSEHKRERNPQRSEPYQTLRDPNRTKSSRIRIELTGTQIKCEKIY